MNCKIIRNFAGGLPARLRFVRFPRTLTTNQVAHLLCRDNTQKAMMCNLITPFYGKNYD